MDYRIVEKEAFEATGKVNIIFQGNNELPELWGDKYVKDGTLNKLLELGKPNTLLGIIYGVNSDGSYHYMVGIETKGVVDGDMETIIIPASTWAVFESIGPLPNAIQNLWTLIFSDFLPGSNYKHVDGPDLEVYYEGDTSAEDYRCEVWIPVIKK